jgi:predicted membrane protein
MPQPIMSYTGAKIISFILFFLGLALLTYLKAWWPGIMLAIGIPLAIRQYLLGRHLDMYVSLFVFGGIFITAQFQIKWEILLPLLFAIGGIYIFLREYIEKKESEEDKK